MCDRPTRNTKDAPRNKHTAPAVTRCETVKVVLEILLLVMDTLRATDFGLELVLRFFARQVS